MFLRQLTLRTMHFYQFLYWTAISSHDLLRVASSHTLTRSKSPSLAAIQMFLPFGFAFTILMSEGCVESLNCSLLHKLTPLVRMVEDIILPKVENQV